MTRSKCNCLCKCKKRPGRKVYCIVCDHGVGPGCCLRHEFEDGDGICHECSLGSMDGSTFAARASQQAATLTALQAVAEVTQDEDAIVQWTYPRAADLDMYVMFPALKQLLRKHAANGIFSRKAIEKFVRRYFEQEVGTIYPPIESLYHYEEQETCSSDDSGLDTHDQTHHHAGENHSNAEDERSRNEDGNVPTGQKNKQSFTSDEIEADKAVYALPRKKKVEGSFNRHGKEGPYYCGYCDTRLKARGFDNRPIHRATHIRVCKRCFSEGGPPSFPACEWCARNAACSHCGSPHAVPYLIKPEVGDTDSSDDEQIQMLDVRAHPPRFCPAARTVERVPYVWKVILDKGWNVAKSENCTGCSKPGPTSRMLFDVIMIYGGIQTQNTSSSSSANAVIAGLQPVETQRYRHKLCWKCAKCVVCWPLQIQAATTDEGLTHLSIAPSRITNAPTCVTRGLYPIQEETPKPRATLRFGAQLTPSQLDMERLRRGLG